MLSSGNLPPNLTGMNLCFAHNFLHRLPLCLHMEVLWDDGKPAHLATLWLKAQEADDNYWMRIPRPHIKTHFLVHIMTK